MVNFFKKLFQRDSLSEALKAEPEVNRVSLLEDSPQVIRAREIAKAQGMATLTSLANAGMIEQDIHDKLKNGAIKSLAGAFTTAGTGDIGTGGGYYDPKTSGTGGSFYSESYKVDPKYNPWVPAIGKTYPTELDEANRKLIEEIMKKGGLTEQVPPRPVADPDVPAWKIAVINAVFSRVASSKHKHPDVGFRFIKLLRDMYPEMNAFEGAVIDEFSRWFCSSEHYKPLFENEDFVLALVGDNRLKLDCEHVEECDCEGETVFTYALNQLKGEEPFEYLQKYMGMA